MTENKFLGVIPARLGSTRFPGKPLKLILGKPMIQWVYENSQKSAKLNDLVVATDAEEIYDAVLSFGGKVTLTSSEHPTGLDRIIEVSQRMNQFTHFINIQGDEPAIHPDTIDGIIQTMIEKPECDIATAAIAFSEYANFLSPHQVKVVFDKNKKALYFSRSPVPYHEAGNCEGAFKHLGIYGYTRKALQAIKYLPPGKLELFEKLEQLRMMESGMSIYIFITRHDSIGVDTPDDIKIAEIILQNVN